MRSELCSLLRGRSSLLEVPDLSCRCFTVQYQGNEFYQALIFYFPLLHSAAQCIEFLGTARLGDSRGPAGPGLAPCPGTGVCLSFLGPQGALCTARARKGDTCPAALGHPDPSPGSILGLGRDVAKPEAPGTTGAGWGRRAAWKGPSAVHICSLQAPRPPARLGPSPWGSAVSKVAAVSQLPETHPANGLLPFHPSLPGRNTRLEPGNPSSHWSPAP